MEYKIKESSLINILFLHAGAEMYGADKVLLDLVRGLDRSVFKPYVILPCNGVLVGAFEKEQINVEVIPYPIMRRKYFNIKGIINYLFGLVKYSKQLTLIAKERNIDIVHTSTAATFEGSLICKKLGIPHLWSIHEIIIKPKIMYRLTSRWISKNASITITDSSAVKEHLLASKLFNQNDIHVIYNGVDSNRFKPENDCLYLRDEWNIPDNAVVIGMMGRVNSWKGQLEFLEAANIVMSKRPNVFTVFIGSAFDGEEWREQELSNAIAKSPFRCRIINKGYRTDSEGIYKLFDIFVLPSTNPDPFPTVVLEAMATGKPIVAYKHGGVCEMISDGENGLLAEVRNPKDLSLKIMTLIDDEGLRSKMGKASRERLLNKFSLASYINDYSNEYFELFRKGKKEK